MMINGFSIFMAIVLFTIVSTICSLFLLRTKSQHLWIIVLVLALCLLRCFFPVEIKGSVTINDWNIYPKIFSLLNRNLLGSLTVGTLICLVWLLAALYFLYQQMCELIRQYRFTKLVTDFPTDSRITEIAKRAAEAVGCKRSVDVHIVPTFFSPIMTGFFRPVVVLPQSAAEMDDTEVEYILRHEISHYLGGDLWYKFVVQFLLCLLWWNPAAYLLRRSVYQLLELRADSRACKSLPKNSRGDYTAVLLNIARHSANARNSSYDAGFIGQLEFEYVHHRIRILLSSGTNRKSPLLTALIAGLCISLFLGSYTFIIQPAALPPEANDSSYVPIAPENAYLVPTSEGNYEVWIDGKLFAVFPEDMIKTPPFSELPIKEKEN